MQAKAYTTRVGSGPYPTEIHGEAAEKLREVGREYGTTTGRPRRVGWLDIPALKYVARSVMRTRQLQVQCDLRQGVSVAFADAVCHPSTGWQSTMHSTRDAEALGRCLSGQDTSLAKSTIHAARSCQ